MTNILVGLKTIINETTNFAGKFKLKNGSVINKFKQGKTDKLSSDTLNNIGSVVGFKQVNLMIPLEATDEQLKCLSDMNASFLKEVDELAKKNLTKDNAKKTNKEILLEEQKLSLPKLEPIKIDINEV